MGLVLLSRRPPPPVSIAATGVEALSLVEGTALSQQLIPTNVNVASAEVGAFTDAGSALFATKLVMVTQPAGAVSAQAFTTQPAVRLQSSGSINVPQSGRVITASLGSGAGTIIGTVTATTDANGVATWTNLGISATAPPSSFTVTFSASGLTSVTSSSFTVTASGGLPALSIYFNSSEPGGDGSDANLLSADNFVTGAPALTPDFRPPAGNYFWPGGPSWYTVDGDHVLVSAAPYNSDETKQKGWWGSIFFGITDGAVATGAGIRGKTCGDHGSDSPGQMASHNFQVSVEEFYARFYTFIPAGYLYGAEKVWTLNLKNASAGIHFGNLHFNLGAGAPQSLGVLCWQGAGGGATNNGIFTMPTAPCWVMIKMHCKLSTGNLTPDGVMQVWADSCGADGLTHPVSPTLRWNVPNYAWPRGTGDGDGVTFGQLWSENWSNPQSSPHRLIDHFWVSRTDFNAFVP